VYCPKCDGSLRLGECFDVHHLGVNYWKKWVTEEQGCQDFHP
jgi:hypothetical protein